MTSKSIARFDNLPGDPEAYDRAMRALAAASTGDDGIPFGKMGKDGRWTYGAEEIPIGPDEEWAVNPQAIRVGVIGWANKTKVGEEMYLLGQGIVDKSALPVIISDKKDDGWKDQISLEFVSMANPDLRLSYGTTSDGGLRAVRALAALMVQNKGKFPVINCRSESYNHREWGKTYKPILNVVRWVDNRPALV